jgi:integrase
MKGKIIKTVVDDLRQRAVAAGKAIYCWDSDLTGFGVVATKAGKASYFIEYRIGGRGTPNRRVSIGKHGPFTPDEARKTARKRLGEVAAGTDVAQAKKDERLKLKAGTFKEVAEKYLETESKDTSHWREMRRVLERDAYSAWGSQPIATITKQQIRAQLDKAKRRAHSGERKLYVALNGLFQWGCERDMPPVNPMSGIAAPPPGKKRKRVLDVDEIKAYWLATGELHEPFRSLYRLFLLLGQRREEVAGMTWEELDLESNAWRLPPLEEVQPKRTKNGQEHIVDLSPQVLAILEALPNERKGLLFTTTGKTPVAGDSKFKKRIDAAMQKQLKKPLRPWVIHDLRRTMSTHMADFLEVDEGVVERILNHISTTEGGLKGVYQRQTYKEKRKLAMIAWGKYVESLVSDKNVSNVVKLRTSA